MSTKTNPTPVAPPKDAVLFTYPEAAFVLRCSVTHVFRQVATGQLPRRKFGRKSLIHRDDLAKFIEDAYSRERPETDAATAIAPERVLLRASGLWDGDDFRAKEEATDRR